MTRTVAASVLLAILAMVPSCERAPLNGPPSLRLGRDECAHCGMLISEDRCSCALLVESEGHRRHLAFDDIGCMLDAERNHEGDYTVIGRYLHDHETRAWIAVESAVLVHADPRSLQTPMGSGMIAFAAQADARKSADQHHGELLDFAALTARRKSWSDARSAATDSPTVTPTKEAP